VAEQFGCFCATTTRSFAVYCAVKRAADPAGLRPLGVRLPLSAPPAKAAPDAGFGAIGTPKSRRSTLSQLVRVTPV
jgi:hypothetical protein